MRITDKRLQQVCDAREAFSGLTELGQVHKDDEKGERKDEGGIGAPSEGTNCADGGKRWTIKADDKRDDRHLEDEKQDGRAAEGI